ncbi:MAG: tRNA lysidine(34) synthetase TilS, partial [Bacteroidota bacterium]|nr:tRNA lysidine(34) synthetase TilS [Bacteroidota bacterium]
MILPDKFTSYIKKHRLFSAKDQLLVAVSGGVDSVVLCELCKIAGFNFTIAHCNFQLRGEESDRDEAFVRSLAESYQVKAFIKKFDTEKFAGDNKLSIQVAARELRYTWFEELRLEIENRQHTIEKQKLSGMRPHRKSDIVHPTFILTAHHANDNIETLLMNFFKGTGIAGLRAIQPRQGKIIRPLLFAKKEEILNFAGENNLRFVEDSSNLSDKYTRNYFRNQL